MIGAIIGDVIGSVYEGEKRNAKEKDFYLFSSKSRCTDDTIISIAVGQALINTYEETDIEKIQKELVEQLQDFGRLYPKAGYGRRFKEWINEEKPEPYNSYGNGSAMRVSPVFWLYDSLEDINKYAEITASITHNHKEGIKGACAIATAIYLASKKKSKNEIKKYIEENFGYYLRTISEIAEENINHGASCQITVPVAIQAFLEGEDFEDVLRTAVFTGGDADTIACMACSIAEVYYEIPKELLEFAYSKMDNCLKKSLKNILSVVNKKNKLNTNLKKIFDLLEKEDI
jgi:ADP-ribosylglycohydrolase family protein